MRQPFTIFSREIDYALCKMLIHSVWQIFAIALIFYFVLLVLKKSDSKTCYIISNFFLLLVFCVAVFTFVYYYNGFAKKSVAYVPPRTILAKNCTSPGVNTGVSQNQKEEFRVSFVSNTIIYLERNFTSIVLMWSLGACFCIIRLLTGVTYIVYLKSRLTIPLGKKWLDVIKYMSEDAGLLKQISLSESGLVRSPIVVGFLKPVILFPTGLLNSLSPEEAEAILAHELAHILRNDYFYNILQSVIESFFYYHPAVWWISSVIRDERENACDDMAVELTGNSLTYAKALVRVREIGLTQLIPATAFSGKGSGQLTMRIQRILKVQSETNNFIQRLIAITLMVALPAAFILSRGDQNAIVPQMAGNNGLNANHILLAAGNSGTDLKEENEFIEAGITDDFVRSFNNLGFGKLSNKQLINAKNYGIDDLFAKQILSAGVHELTFDDVIRFNLIGIDAKYISGIKKAGAINLTAAEIINLWNLEVTPSFISELKNKYSKGLNADEIAQFKTAE